MRPVCCAALAAAAVGLAGTPAGAHDDPGGMQMVGNMAPYPDLNAAGAENVARARRLLRASRAAARRFDTTAKARRLGYVPGRAGFVRPGFTHLRKHNVRFWGRLLDPAAPQSLVYWCPTAGRCTLAVFMFRAPGGMPPDTWGDILQWHRHNAIPRATWMTHVWLVRDLPDAFATCAPMPALARDLGIRDEPYPRGSHRLTPCEAPAM
jgi:hypothetical protein